MASPVPYSYRQYTGNGTVKDFAVPFPYIERAHVHVYLGFDLLDGTFTSELAETSGYTWTSGTVIRTVVAPAAGTTLTVIRRTPNGQQLVEWVDGSNLIAADLNTSDLQNLYVVQEQQDRNDAVVVLAEEAVDIANDALDAIADVVQYTPVPNVAGIPVSPDDGTYIDIANSTGVESFSPLFGRPVGFVGDSGLNVRLRYTSSPATWNWVSYYPNNPEIRYLKQAGGTLTGPLVLAGAPTAALNPATKAYTDAADALKASKAGDTMTGPLAMSGNKVTGLGAPTAGADAATKTYVDSVAGSTTPGSITDASVAAGAGIQATKLAFTQAGTGAVARTVDSKLKDVVHVKDLGCICNGIADDGATLNAAIYARYSGLATSQSQEYVEIHASPGDVLKFVTPVTVRQNRIRFIGNGAKIVCTGQYAFDFTQDGSGNINEDGGVIGWKITGATVAAIRGRACAFTRIENNWFTANNEAINIQAVGAIIRNNYIRQNTGSGITLQSAVVVGGGRSESQRCVVEHNRVYLNGGIGIFLKDGGGHYLGGNDLEVNTSVELLVRSSFGNTIIGLYSEPAAGIPIIQIDNASTDVPGRNSESNQIIGGTFGGGAAWDINIAGGNSTVVSGVRFGIGKINIAAGVSNTVLLPCNGNTPTVTNNGSGTLDMTTPGKIKMYASTVNRILLDATDAIGGVVSGVDNLLHLAGVKGISTSQTKSKNLFGFVDITGTATTAAVTFGTAEVDQAYGAFFGVWHVAGTPASGSEAVYMTARATSGFTINLRAAPGAGNTVRVHWMIMR
jgi:hypothetical protein